MKETTREFAGGDIASNYLISSVLAAGVGFICALIGYVVITIAGELTDSLGGIIPKEVKTGISIGLALMGIMVFKGKMKNWAHQVKVGEVHIVTFFGQPTETILEPGDRFLPFKKKVFDIIIRSILIESIASKDKVDAISKDTIPLSIDNVEIRYQLDKDNILKTLDVNLDTLKKDLESNVLTFVRQVISKLEWDKVTGIKDLTNGLRFDKNKSETEIKAELEKKFEDIGVHADDIKICIEYAMSILEQSKQYGFVVLAIQIGDVILSEAFKKAAEKKKIEEFERDAERTEANHTLELVDAMVNRMIAQDPTINKKEAYEIAVANANMIKGKDVKIIHTSGKGGGLINNV